VKEKLKPEYMGLPGDKIKSLKASGVIVTLPETSLQLSEANLTSLYSWWL
jgi:hypothetical protein